MNGLCSVSVRHIGTGSGLDTDDGGASRPHEGQNLGGGSLVNGDVDDGIQAILSTQSCTVGLLQGVDSSCHCVVPRLSYMMGISVCGGDFSYIPRFCVFGAVAGNIFSHHLDLPLDNNMYGLEFSTNSLAFRAPRV